MIPSVSRDHPTVITFLLILLFSVKNVTSDETMTQQPVGTSFDPGSAGFLIPHPHWESGRRDFLFKTILQPHPPVNNMLFKELLEAPFYTGPLPATGTISNDGEISLVLSRGEVYHLDKGGWIICQEGCTDCEICMVHRQLNTPTITWILRKIKRQDSIFPIRQRQDVLQLTVVPQIDDGSRMRTAAQAPFIYITSNNEKALDSFIDTLLKKNEDYNPMPYPISTTKSPDVKTPRDVFTPEKKGSHTVNEKVPGTDSKITSTMISDTKNSSEMMRGREIDQGMQELHPELVKTPEIDPRIKPIDRHADCKSAREDTQIIFGTDHNGDKHLIHVLPARQLYSEIKKSSASMYPGDGSFDHKPEDSLDPVEVVGPILYRKIFQRVVDSLNNHKSSIEKFLQSPKSPSSFLHEKSLGNFSALDFYRGGNSPSINNGDDNNQTIIPGEGNINENDNRDETKFTTGGNDNLEEIIGRNGDGFFTRNMTELEPAVDQEPKIYGIKFEDEIFGKNFSDESINGDQISKSLILKEVAKSVAGHLDTLGGFNPAANNLSSIYNRANDSVFG